STITIKNTNPTTTARNIGLNNTISNISLATTVSNTGPTTTTRNINLNTTICNT
ncbi:27301_t:CDS:1, partial [Racocetra persica]